MLSRHVFRLKRANSLAESDGPNREERREDAERKKTVDAPELWAYAHNRSLREADFSSCQDLVADGT